MSFCGVPRRYYCFSVLLCLGCFNLYTLRVCLFIAIQPIACQYNISNDTQGLIQSSFFVGYLFGNIIGGYASSKYAANTVFGFSILLTAILTIIIPISTTSYIFNPYSLTCKCDDSIAQNWCFIDNIYTKDQEKCNSLTDICNQSGFAINPLLFLRFLMGLFGGGAFPALYAMLSNWAPPNESSSILSVAISGVYIATASTSMISSAIIDHSNWQNVFYFFSIMAFIWYAFWYCYAYNSPFQDPLMSKNEIEYLKLNITETKKDKNRKIPWKIILTNSTVLSVILCHFANSYTFDTMLTQLPTYLSKTLNYNLSEAGIVTIATNIGQFLVSLLSSIIADKYIMNENNASFVRKCASVLSTIVPASLLLLCAFSENGTFVVIMLILTKSFMGFATCGVYGCFTDISNVYSSVIYGLSNTIATLTGIIAPIVSGYILKENNNQEWSIVFFISFVINLIGISIFCIVAHVKIIPELSQIKVKAE